MTPTEYTDTDRDSAACGRMLDLMDELERISGVTVTRDTPPAPHVGLSADVTGLILRIEDQSGNSVLIHHPVIRYGRGYRREWRAWPFGRRVSVREIRRRFLGASSAPARNGGAA